MRVRNATTTRRRPTRRDGFTLIEVMIAAGIIMVGAVGIMALQQAATRGNRESREVMTATTTTQSWLELLGRTTRAWRTNSISGTLNIPYLSQIANQAQTTGWFVPVPPNGAQAGLYPSAALDFHGIDPTSLPGGSLANTRYCTVVRLTWLNPYSSMRADVITWWQREAQGAGATNGQLYPNCGAGGNAQPIVDDAQVGGRLHSVYGSTVLRWNGSTANP